MASYLQKRLKLQAGDRIAIQLPNLIQYPVVAIAAMKLGLVIVNTNPMYSVRELVHQFNDAGVRAVIVLDQFYDLLAEAAPQTSVEHIIVTRPLDLMSPSKQTLLGGLMMLMGKRPRIKGQDIIDFKDLLAGGTSYGNHRASVDDICALQYTGGTTGPSKGVMLTQSCLTANVAQALDVISVAPESARYSVTALPLPLYHIYAFSLCVGVLPALRGHSVLIPDPRNIPLFDQGDQEIENSDCLWFEFPVCCAVRK